MSIRSPWNCRNVFSASMTIHIPYSFSVSISYFIYHVNLPFAFSILSCRDVNTFDWSRGTALCAGLKKINGPSNSIVRIRAVNHQRACIHIGIYICVNLEFSVISLLMKRFTRSFIILMKESFTCFAEGEKMRGIWETACAVAGISNMVFCMSMFNYINMTLTKHRYYITSSCCNLLVFPLGNRKVTLIKVPNYWWWYQFV